MARNLLSWIFICAAIQFSFISFGQHVWMVVCMEWVRKIADLSPPLWVGQLQICTWLGFLILLKHAVGFVEPSDSETHRRWPKHITHWAETSFKVANPMTGQTPSHLVEPLIKTTLPYNLYMHLQINIYFLYAFYQ